MSEELPSRQSKRNSLHYIMFYSPLDGGWMFRTDELTLCGPYKDYDTAFAAALLVFGNDTNLSAHMRYTINGG